jgi:hypothetical protein
MNMRTYFKKMVEDGGGEFIDLRDNAVFFRSAPGEPIVRLYPAALKSPEDVGLALKNCRERKQAQAWNWPNI